ncbi:hypothetical protein LPJ61_006409, partial [Coemansia biformis]
MLQRALSTAARRAAVSLGPGFRLPATVMAARGLARPNLRMYSDEKMLEGTPRFTRMRRKWARKGPQDLLEGSMREREREPEPEEPVSGRKWGFSAEVRVAAGQAALMSLCSGITFVILYHVGAYIYTMRLWPAPDEIQGIKARAMFNLARYYEYMSPKPERVVALLERVLDLAEAQDGGIDPDSLVALDTRLRIAQCQYALGRKAEAEKTLNVVLPIIQRLPQTPQASYADDRDSHSGDWLSPDMLLYRLAALLGKVYVDSGRADEAVEIYSRGIQAVTRMKEDVAATFDSDHPLDYTTYDNMNLKEAVLTCGLGQAFYLAKNYRAADTMLRATINSVKRHKAHMESAPRVIANVWEFKDEWVCMDAQAMLYLAKIQMDAGNSSAALPWIVAGRKLTTTKWTFDDEKCTRCESGLLSQLGRIAELQGRPHRALLRYREAYNHSRLALLGDEDNIAAD